MVAKLEKLCVTMSSSVKELNEERILLTSFEGFEIFKHIDEIYIYELDER